MNDRINESINGMMEKYKKKNKHTSWPSLNSSTQAKPPINKCLLSRIIQFIALARKFETYSLFNDFQLIFNDIFF